MAASAKEKAAVAADAAECEVVMGFETRALVAAAGLTGALQVERMVDDVRLLETVVTRKAAGSGACSEACLGMSLAVDDLGVAAEQTAQ